MEVKAIVNIGACAEHQLTFAPTVGNVGCTRCNYRRLMTAEEMARFEKQRL